MLYSENIVVAHDYYYIIIIFFLLLLLVLILVFCCYFCCCYFVIPTTISFCVLQFLFLGCRSVVIRLLLFPFASFHFILINFYLSCKDLFNTSLLFTFKYDFHLYLKCALSRSFNVFLNHLCAL